ncbi:MAG: DUF2721 domain-containing protein [Desulfuromonadaceae bacterium]|nr:DUF2721 domain-containing protein [Desulfuromonadaceae bacterium]MDD2856578.1 DUF2721 domain-containing protein [Desulfuromonadaceae bacterium]
MAIIEKEIIESLNSSRILTSMITPAVLISACGTLIFSTSARLGRIFDRVNVMKGEVEAIITGKISHPVERLSHLRDQIGLQRRRAQLIQKAMVSLYSATLFFVAASLAIAVNVAYGSYDLAWIATLIALSGGLFLFIASSILLYESRFNLRFVHRSIDFIEILEKKAEEELKKVG